MPFDPELVRARDAPVDPDTGEPLDCTRCGACCTSGPGAMLIEDADLVRWRRQGRHDLAERTAEGHFGLRAFPTDEEGACIYLSRPEGRSLCSIYEDRGSVCREFQAGSWQCLEFRRDALKRRGPLYQPCLLGPGSGGGRLFAPD
ncbi:MAG TPA: YkgJ family cysteine cluster protein [Polyangiaceae bacterium]|nr:YkgJ family cysteine cluster protein [Polyangiaceae bacterium]